ncbi:DNA translocase FtsK [Streptomyces scabiei]|uniref:DNA translocase FtsK n=1 Tax=Streptomyces scabiei TaxID=1930 RepID=UPI0029A3CFE2|nr:DNA translocase FtsK [Streptomyces scabiei]MDX3520750.1 DNA translocase FtsK [Streptomyces scabiei]
MTSTPDTDEQELDRALYLVASRRLAAPSALQRWMNITFARAVNLLNELEQRGHVGPAHGSLSRSVLVRCCEQCGRIGKRGYRTHTAAEHGIEITVCANKAACRKRWPKPADDDA